MNWGDERYVRVYTRDTIEWNMLCWQARAIWSLLLRKVDRSGVLDLGRFGYAGLAKTIMMPLEVVTAGLDGAADGPGLLEDGCVVANGTKLVLRNFIEAQEATASDAARAKAYRERLRVEAQLGPKPAVTKRDEPSQNVTLESRDVTSRHEPNESSLLSVPIRAVPPVPSFSEPEKECEQAGEVSSPLKLVAQFFERTGVLEADPYQLRQVADLVVPFARKVGRELDRALFDDFERAFRAVQSTWSTPGRRTPVLFVRHWESIQVEFAGAASKPQPTPARFGSPEPARVPSQVFDAAAKAREAEAKAKADAQWVLDNPEDAAKTMARVERDLERSRRRRGAE